MHAEFFLQILSTLKQSKDTKVDLSDDAYIEARESTQLAQLKAYFRESLRNTFSCD